MQIDQDTALFFSEMPDLRSVGIGLNAADLFRLLLVDGKDFTVTRQHCFMKRGTPSSCFTSSGSCISDGDAE